MRTDEMLRNHTPSILLVSDVTEHGGTTKYLCQQATAARSAGWNCHVLLDDGPGTDPVARMLLDGGIGLTRRPLYHGHHSELQVAESMRTTLSYLRPNVVHVTCGSIRSAIVPREVTLEERIPLLFTEQYVSRMTEVSTDCLLRLRRIHAKAWAVITVSHENRVLLSQLIGACTERLFVIPNAVCLSEQLRPPRTTTPKKIVTVTRLTHQKGVDTLLRASSRLSEETRNEVQFTVIGDGELRSQLLMLAQDLGLSDRYVRFEGWRNDINEILEDYDLFVLPSRAEGQPFVLLEALVQGLPCITTWVSGNPEILADGAYGALLPPDDPDAFTEAITRFLARPQHLRALSSRVGSHLRVHHDIEVNMGHVINLWEEAIARRNGQGMDRTVYECPKGLKVPVGQIPRLLVVIVSADDGRWLTSCFSALEQSRFKDFDVMLIDNCSSDETTKAVTGSLPTIQHFRTHKRLSFAEANNPALREAMSKGYRYVMLLNPDTRIHSDAIGTLVDFLDSKPEFGIVGSWQSTYGDDTWSQPNEWTRQILADARRQGVQPRREDAFTIIETTYVQGAALMARTGLLTQIGLLDTVYGTFYEETDLCRRCRLYGRKVGLVLESRVQHEGGGNWRCSARANRWRDYLYLRNQLLYELSEPHLSELPLRRAWEVVLGQLHSVRHGHEDVVLSLWQYPRVLVGVLLRLGYLSSLRTRNTNILSAHAIPEELHCIGPRSDWACRAEQEAVVVNSVKSEQVLR